jgi:hypothetical protein
MSYKLAFYNPENSFGEHKTVKWKTVAKVGVAVTESSDSCDA